MIYRLDHNISHIVDKERDAELIKFPNSDDVMFSSPELDFTNLDFFEYIPHPMEFVGNLDVLAKTDHPYIVPSDYPMISLRLLDALLTAGEFRYQTYSTRIYDEALTEDVRYQSDYTRTDCEVTDPTQYTDRFIMLRLLDSSNVLDLERTICAVDTDDDDSLAVRACDTDRYKSYGSIGIDKIERLALAVPEEQLPGVFVMRELYGLYCTDRTVQSCQKSGIVGVKFTPIPSPLYKGVRPIPGGFRLLREDQLPV